MQTDAIVYDLANDRNATEQAMSEFWSNPPDEAVFAHTETLRQQCDHQRRDLTLLNNDTYGLQDANEDNLRSVKALEKRNVERQDDRIQRRFDPLGARESELQRNLITQHERVLNLLKECEDATDMAAYESGARGDMAAVQLSQDEGEEHILRPQLLDNLEGIFVHHGVKIEELNSKIHKIYNQTEDVYNQLGPSGSSSAVVTYREKIQPDLHNNAYNSYNYRQSSDLKGTERDRRRGLSSDTYQAYEPAWASTPSNPNNPLNDPE